MNTAPATVRRWARHGKDRAYVTAGDGARLGYLDLLTGKVVLSVPERLDEFTMALSDAGYTTGEAASDVPSVSAAPVETDWQDLADNRPGQAAREQANQALADQRSRSRIGSAIARAFDVKTEERAWRKGAEGEEAIGNRLEKLTKLGWFILHAVPVGDRGSDIDHVVIGPGGVFTLNTKNHPGKRITVGPNWLRVDGYAQPYLRNSRHEAQRASRLLSARVGWEVPVKPALILLTGTVIPEVIIKSGGPKDVLILDRVDVPRVFKRTKETLKPDQVDAVFQAARRSTTWTT